MGERRLWLSPRGGICQDVTCMLIGRVLGKRVSTLVSERLVSGGGCVGEIGTKIAVAGVAFSGVKSVLTNGGLSVVVNG